MRYSLLLTALAWMLALQSPTRCADDRDSSLDRRLAEIESRLEELEALRAEVKLLKQEREASRNKEKPSGVKDTPSVHLSGYVQAQYTREAGEGINTGELGARRARLRIDARLSPKATVSMETDNSRGVDLRRAHVDLDLGRVRLRAGQFKVPLSQQIVQSSSLRLTPERALINTRSVPGENDRGVLAGIPLIPDRPNSPVIELGLFNGRGLNQTDNNTDKDLFAAIHLPSMPVAARLAFLYGRYTNLAPPNGDGRNATKLRYSADLQYVHVPWNVEMQVARGQGDFPIAGGNLTLADVQGGYLQLAHNRSHNPLTLVARYQYYDPNTNASRNSIHGPLLGAVLDPDHALRYMLSIERLNDRARPGSRYALTLRTQVKF